MRFNAAQTIGPDARTAIAQKTGRELPAAELTRGQVAQWLDAQGIT